MEKALAEKEKGVAKQLGLGGNEVFVSQSTFQLMRVLQRAALEKKVAFVPESAGVK